MVSKEYDCHGNLRDIYSFIHSQLYVAKHIKLFAIHRATGGLNAYVDSIDYVGNLILKNGQPSMYLFDGGYVSFSNDTIEGWHYYIKDYMGNNRMVVNMNGTVEQLTHYYPYGGVIGDISTNESVQKYKLFHYIPREQARSEGKKLDRTFGLDNYDIHVRQYFAMMPSWNRIDDKAEDYYPISPYAYCGGDPINKMDLNGNNFYVLLARNGARGFGHMGLLIQEKEDKWFYYSKEGHDHESVKRMGPFDSLEDFQSSDNPKKLGRDRYTDSYLVQTDETETDAKGKTPDERATEAAIQEINKEYNPATANCSDVVKSALSAAGKPDGTAGGNAVGNSIPNVLFPRIVIQNETLNILKSIWETIKDLFTK